MHIHHKFAGILLLAISRVPASAEPAEINDRTTCAFAAKVFDESDRETATAIAGYIARVLRAEDARTGNNMVGRLSPEGFSKINVLPISFCRENMRSTLRKATLDTYEGIVAMQKELQGQ